MWWPFSRSKPLTPVKVETDTVIPLHWMDDTQIFRAMILYFTLRFDDVLDPELLRVSLEKLLDRDGWRKLGARLRLNETTKRLDYHVPASFDAKRPAFAYAHKKVDGSIEDHPLASQLPKATERAAVLRDQDEFIDLARLREDGPKRIEDYLYREEPQLSLNIMSFNDATLVSISWPHTFLDALGRKALIDAWIQVINGEEYKVPPMCGVDTDPLEKLGTAPKETFVEAKNEVVGFQFFRFVVNYILELLFHKKDASRAVFIPARVLQKLKSDAHAATASDRNDPSETLTDGDILSALHGRLATLHLPPTSTQPVTILNALGIRRVLTPTYLPPGSVFIANAVMGSLAYTTVRELHTLPLGAIALKIRRAILAHRSLEQVDAMAGLMRRRLAESKRSPLFSQNGDGSMMYLAVSNWTGGRFFEADFSAAVVRQGGLTERVVEGRPERKGRASYINVSGYSNGFSKRGAMPVIGRDAAGNYWLGPFLRASLWERIAVYVDKLGEE